MTARPTEQPGELAVHELTVQELADRTGVSVRTVRFYAGRRLLPPPRLVGRTGYYGPAHLARLTLIRELQEAGYTLTAVEEFLASLPGDADADTVALFGALLTPWVGRERVELTWAQVGERLGQPIDGPTVTLLERAGALQVLDGDRVVLDEGQLEFALRLLDLDMPVEALLEAADAIRRHATTLARELQQVFRERIVAQRADPSPEAREGLRALAAALRPLTLQAIITAYTEALEREVRGVSPVA